MTTPISSPAPFVASAPNRPTYSQPAATAISLKDEASAFQHLFASNVRYGASNHGDQLTGGDTMEHPVPPAKMPTQSELGEAAAPRAEAADRTGSPTPQKPVADTFQLDHGKNVSVAGAHTNSELKRGSLSSIETVPNETLASYRSRQKNSPDLLATVYVDEDGAQVLVKDRSAGDLSLADLTKALKSALGRMGFGLAKLKVNGNKAL